MGPQFSIENEDQYRALVQFVLEEDNIVFQNIEHGAVVIVNELDEATRCDILDDELDESFNTDTGVDGSDE